MWWKYDKYRILILWLATCLMQAYCNIRLIFHHRFGVPGAINWYYCICWFFKKWQYFSVCNVAMVGQFSVVHWPRLYYFWLNCISIMSPEGWIVDFTLSLFEHLQPLLGKSRQCKSHYIFQRIWTFITFSCSALNNRHLYQIVENVCTIMHCVCVSRLTRLVGKSDRVNVGNHISPL